MKFTTPCFVRFKDAEEQKDLYEWLKGIGYKQSFTNPYLGIIAAVKYGTMIEDAYDCGTNVALFKALAAMNDSNDREQWFIDRVGGDDEYDPKGDHGWYLCKDDKLRCAVDCYSKATAEEIIKHFSDDK